MSRKHRNELRHYGTPRHSGRYPWGSGDNPYQHNSAFLKRYSDLKKSGKTESEIAKAMNCRNTTELRAKHTIATNNKRAADVAYAEKLKEKGYSTTEIGRRMGVNESTVRSYLDPARKERKSGLDNTVRAIKEEVDKKRYLDVGAGVEYQLNGVSKDRLKKVVGILKEEGYKVHSVKVEQMGTKNMTTLKVLGAPDTEWKEVVKDPTLIKEIKLSKVAQPDGTSIITPLKYPTSVDSKRIMIRYSEDGGSDKDGVIELRRGVEDISLDNSMYAQVRIAVDNTHYLKGMAMYASSKSEKEMPPGVDIIFNTNKSKETPPEKVYKELKTNTVDPNNPFGAAIKIIGGQREYLDANGNKQLSPINKVNEEGDWSKWSKTLASQMLSKQPRTLIKKQLDLSYASKREEFETIMSNTNPAVKKRLLEAFADKCDSDAVKLKAAALPRQASHVILPINSLKDNEIYAPHYRDGERVVLIRYPHGGKFEIPELIVNNRNREANEVMHNAVDAVGINSKVAQRLSGADFDGDTVLVIPNNNSAIKTSSPLKALQNFNPNSYEFSKDICMTTGVNAMKREVKRYSENKEYQELKQKMSSGYSPTDDDYIKVGQSILTIKPQTKQTEMGKVSNLITDMTLKGANDDELARAVKHSMVVIDAEKHHLDYKKSEVDNGIKELKQKYQGGGGASTLISLASSETHIPKQKERGFDKKTGEKIFEPTNEYFIREKINKRTGEVTKEKIFRLQDSTRMADTKDAFTLSSGTLAETEYAKYANNMKALGNEARLATVGLSAKYNPSAAKAYKTEVDSLNYKLRRALQNAPYERQAQIIANSIYKTQLQDNPGMTKDDKKKYRNMALQVGRTQAGASKKAIDITDKEWEAIQAGAVSNSKLKSILDNSDLDRIKELSTPRQSIAMSTAKVNLAKSMSSSGYSIAEIADRLGVSTSTVSRALKKKEGD